MLWGATSWTTCTSYSMSWPAMRAIAWTTYSRNRGSETFSDNMKRSLLEGDAGETFEKACVELISDTARPREFKVFDVEMMYQDD